MIERADSLESSWADSYPAISEIQRLLDEMTRLIQQIEVRHARKPSVRLRSLIEASEPTARDIMDALGATLSAFLETKPPPDVLEWVRTVVAARLRAWSSTSPVFFHVSHTPRNAFDGFEISELLLDNRPGGADVASQILDHYYLNLVTVHAYRQRVAQLVEQIADLTKQYANASQPVRILNLHTGAARELMVLAKERTFARVADVTCVDSDAAALRRAGQHLNGLMTRRITTLRADPRTFVTSPAAAEPLYDIIYATTLFDQLKDRAATKLITDCLRRLTPGGVLLFGNFAPSMPSGDRLFIEWAMDWAIRCRSEEHLRRIFMSLPSAVQNLKFLYDPFRASILVVATK